MTPTIFFDLTEAEAKIRLAASTLDTALPLESARFATLMEAAARIAHAREALQEMASAPVPPHLRGQPRRFRVIDGGAA
jgi:hypothetical protein